MRRPFAYGVAPGGGLTLSEVEGNDITGWFSASIGPDSASVLAESGPRHTEFLIPATLQALFFAEHFIVG